MPPTLDQLQADYGLAEKRLRKAQAMLRDARQDVAESISNPELRFAAVERLRVIEQTLQP